MPRSLGLFAGLVRPFTALLGLKAASGVLLFASAAAALLWANLHGESYRAVFDLPLGMSAGAVSAQLSLRELISEVLMAVFFFAVGMEIKRELVSGALNTLSRALLPAVAALGGMAVPALVYLAFNRGGPGASGWGVPMATDIAFCVGVFALLGARVPRELVVFITALAVFDDIGGILVIALFYGGGVDPEWLASAALVVALLVVMNRGKVTNGLVYGSLGAALWYTLHHSGVHATLSGVVVGLMIPAKAPRPPHDVLQELSAHLAGRDPKASSEALDADEVLMIEEKLEDLEAPLARFLHTWHPLVAWFVMPVFALASAGVALDRFDAAGLSSPIALGAALGLVVGKPLGIFGFTFAAVKLKLARVPGEAPLAQLFAVSIVAGIGFTVALFIAVLAFPGAEQLGQAKAGVLVGSLVAMVLGTALAWLTGRRTSER